MESVRSTVLEDRVVTVTSSMIKVTYNKTPVSEEPRNYIERLENGFHPRGPCKRIYINDQPLHNVRRPCSPPVDDPLPNTGGFPLCRIIYSKPTVGKSLLPSKVTPINYSSICASPLFEEVNNTVRSQRVSRKKKWTDNEENTPKRRGPPKKKKTDSTSDKVTKRKGRLRKKPKEETSRDVADDSINRQDDASPPKRFRRSQITRRTSKPTATSHIRGLEASKKVGRPSVRERRQSRSLSRRSGQGTVEKLDGSTKTIKSRGRSSRVESKSPLDVNKSEENLGRAKRRRGRLFVKSVTPTRLIISRVSLEDALEEDRKKRSILEDILKPETGPFLGFDDVVSGKWEERDTVLLSKEKPALQHPSSSVPRRKSSRVAHRTIPDIAIPEIKHDNFEKRARPFEPKVTDPSEMEKEDVGSNEGISTVPVQSEEALNFETDDIDSDRQNQEFLGFDDENSKNEVKLDVLKEYSEQAPSVALESESTDFSQEFSGFEDSIDAGPGNDVEFFLKKHLTKDIAPCAVVESPVPHGKSELGKASSKMSEEIANQQLSTEIKDSNRYAVALESAPSSGAEFKGVCRSRRIGLSRKDRLLHVTPKSIKEVVVSKATGKSPESEKDSKDEAKVLPGREPSNEEDYIAGDDDLVNDIVLQLEDGTSHPQTELVAKELIVGQKDGISAKNEASPSKIDERGRKELQKETVPQSTKESMELSEQVASIEESLGKFVGLETEPKTSNDVNEPIELQTKKKAPKRKRPGRQEAIAESKEKDKELHRAITIDIKSGDLSAIPTSSKDKVSEDDMKKTDKERLEGLELPSEKVELIETETFTRKRRNDVSCKANHEDVEVTGKEVTQEKTESSKTKKGTLRGRRKIKEDVSCKDSDKEGLADLELPQEKTEVSKTNGARRGRSKVNDNVSYEEDAKFTGKEVRGNIEIPSGKTEASKEEKVARNRRKKLVVEESVREEELVEIDALPVVMEEEIIEETTIPDWTGQIVENSEVVSIPQELSDILIPEKTDVIVRNDVELSIDAPKELMQPNEVVDNTMEEKLSVQAENATKHKKGVIESNVMNDGERSYSPVYVTKECKLKLNEPSKNDHFLVVLLDKLNEGPNSELSSKVPAASEVSLNKDVKLTMSEKRRKSKGDDENCMASDMPNKITSSESDASAKKVEKKSAKKEKEEVKHESKSKSEEKGSEVKKDLKRKGVNEVDKKGKSNEAGNPLHLKHHGKSKGAKSGSEESVPGQESSVLAKVKDLRDKHRHILNLKHSGKHHKSKDGSATNHLPKDQNKIHNSDGGDAKLLPVNTEVNQSEGGKVRSISESKAFDSALLKDKKKKEILIKTIERHGSHTVKKTQNDGISGTLNENKLAVESKDKKKDCLSKHSEKKRSDVLSSKSELKKASHGLSVEKKKQASDSKALSVSTEVDKLDRIMITEHASQSEVITSPIVQLSQIHIHSKSTDEKAETPSVEKVKKSSVEKKKQASDSKTLSVSTEVDKLSRMLITDHASQSEVNMSPVVQLSQLHIHSKSTDEKAEAPSVEKVKKSKADSVPQRTKAVEDKAQAPKHGLTPKSHRERPTGSPPDTDKKATRIIQCVNMFSGLTKTPVRKDKKDSKEKQKRPHLVVNSLFAPDTPWATRPGAPQSSVSNIFILTVNSGTRAAAREDSSGTTLTVEPYLPPGWKRVIQTRCSGASQGKRSVVLYSPNGKRLSSKRKLQEYLESNNLPYALEQFNFSILQDSSKEKQSYKETQGKQSKNNLKAKNHSHNVMGHHLTKDIRENSTSFSIGASTDCDVEKGGYSHQNQWPKMQHHSSPVSTQGEASNKHLPSKSAKASLNSFKKSHSKSSKATSIKHSPSKTSKSPVKTQSLVRKEGVLYVDPRLPKGWKREIRRQPSGRTEVYLISSDGKKFRRRSKLEVYLAQENLPYNAGDFDFSLIGRPAAPENGLPLEKEKVAKPGKSLKRKRSDAGVVKSAKKRKVEENFVEKVKEVEADEREEVEVSMTREEAYQFYRKVTSGASQTRINAEDNVSISSAGPDISDFELVRGLVLSADLGNERSERRLSFGVNGSNCTISKVEETEERIPAGWVASLAKCRPGMASLDDEAANSIAMATECFMQRLAHLAVLKGGGTDLSYSDVADVIAETPSLKPLSTLIPQKISFRQFRLLNRPTKYFSFKV